jgi:hypothetical protein
MMVIGIDPGLTGAMSLVCTQRGMLECEDIPTCSNGTASGSMKRWVDVRKVATMLADWSQRHAFASFAVRAVVERPIPMPTLPAQTIASQFDTFGALRGVLSKYDPEPLFPNPNEWKKALKLGPDKTASRKCCLGYFPGAPVSLVKHHNRAEALLIARYGLDTLA